MDIDEKENRARCDLGYAALFLRDAEHMLGLVLRLNHDVLAEDEAVCIGRAMEAAGKAAHEVEFHGGLRRLNGRS